MSEFGVLNEELARASASVQSLVTVHTMATFGIAQGGEGIHDELVRCLVRGDKIAAFALTEPGAGSDASAVATVAVKSGDGYVLNGEKCWVTYGQLADVYLVIAKVAGASAAFVVPRACDGVIVGPSPPLSALRASMQAHIRLVDVVVPAKSLVGRVGLGVSHIAGSALMHGRYCVAWASVGIAQLALEASANHATARLQAATRLSDHQLVRRLLTEAYADVETARLMCERAGRAHDTADPRAADDTLLAKYVASRAAVRVAEAARQILGARGFIEGSDVERCCRDARALEVVEGPTEVLQDLIGARVAGKYAH